MARRALLGMVFTAGCATIFGPPDDPPPEVLTAHFVRTVSPNMREKMWTPLFDGKEYVARLVCASDDWVSSKPTEKKGLVESFELTCPGEAPTTLSFDVGYDPPAAPAGFRLLDIPSFARYREAFSLAEKKDYPGAERALEEAEELAPQEPIYSRDRIYLLYQMGKLSEAFLESDEIARRHPSAVLYKYRALAARDLGLRSEVITSLDGMIRLTHEGHPLYAEAICGKGLMLQTIGDPQATHLIERGCELNYATCCETLKAHPPEPQPPPTKPDVQAAADAAR